MARSDSGLLWVEEVCSDWPGPIAHEYRRLKRMFPETRTAAMAGDYRVLEAFIQLRDVAELLLKLPTVVMLRDADRLDLDNTNIKKAMLGSPPSFGNWYQWGYALAKTIQDADEAWTRDVARVFRTDRGKITGLAKLFNGSEGLIHWRNHELAHGALRKDLAGLGRELTEKVISLNEQLATVADIRPWENVSLRIAGSQDALIGADSIRHGHDQSVGDHLEKPADIVAECTGRSHRLPLGPYLAARTCTKCDKQDVFFFNGRSGETPASQVQYLEYRMGHSMLERQSLERRWKDEAADAKGAKARGSVGDNWIDTATSELLDSTDFEQEYVPPTYLADTVREFLAAHDRGILWLRAPAHTGKSVFAEHASQLLADDPGDLLTVTFTIKREYRWGIAAFSRFIRKAFFSGQNDNHLLPWERAGKKPLAECFLAEAPQLLDRALDVSMANERVLIIVDGLDELPAPGTGDAPDVKHGIADLIPKADLLPEGMFLLLTSRPTTRGETPRWITRKLEASLRRQKHCGVVDIGRDSPAYRGLLRQVFDKALVTHAKKSRKPKQPDQLFESIGHRADWTFLHFGHIVRLLRDGVISEDDLACMKEHGDQLFMAYLRKLEETIGPKQFGLACEMLLVLAACEEAHAQAARIVPPLFFDADWRGIPLDELMGLLHELSPGSGKHGPRVSLRVLFLLKSVEDILRSHRGDDEYARHRIGLKGMVAAMREDRTAGGWAERLDRTHLRLVKEAIAAERSSAQAPDDDNVDEDAPHQQYLHWHGWYHARAVIELGGAATSEAATQLLGAYVLPKDLLHDKADQFRDEWRWHDAIETLSILIDHIRWQSGDVPSTADLTDLAKAHCNRGAGRESLYDSEGASEDLDRAILLTQQAMMTAGPHPPWDLRYGLAVTHINRGSHHADHGDVLEAAADFDEAIAMLKKLRTHAKPDSRRNADQMLATALMNRGNCFSVSDDVPATRQCYNHAIEILRDLRRARGLSWDVDICSTLASALARRGGVFEESDDLIAASKDYAEAINLLERSLGKLEDDGPLDAWQTLAEAYAARGGLTKPRKNAQRAIADYRQAILLFKTLQEIHDDECPPEVPVNLARAYENRADLHAEAGRYRLAIADYDRAIKTLERLGETLGEERAPDTTEVLTDLYKIRAELQKKV